MNLADLAELADFAGVILGFTFTVLVFSYLIGDNPFFRFAIHLFIGVASGFALVVVIYNVFYHQVILSFYEEPAGSLYLIPPLLLGAWLLFTKPSPRLSRLGNPVMAFLVGAGAATAIGGAVLGTIFPQVGASSNLFDLASARQNQINLVLFFLRGLVVLFATLTTLVYFHFGARAYPDRAPARHPIIEQVAQVGQIFIAITFGVVFAGVFSASLAALVERLNFIVELLTPLLPTL